MNFLIRRIGYNLRSNPNTALVANFYQKRVNTSTLSTEKKIASLARDGVFKSIFVDPANPSKLISFLNSIRNPDQTNEIAKIEFQDPYFPAYSSGEKDIYVDLICKTWDKEGKNSEKYVVEMQRAENEGYIRRWEFYASRCYTNELMRAKTYDMLSRVNVVAIMLHPCKYKNGHYSLMNQKTGEVITESRSLTLLSLGELSSELLIDDPLSKKWSHLIKFSGTNDLKTEILEKDPDLFNAIQDLANFKGPVSPKNERVSRGAPWHLSKQLIRDKVREKTRETPSLISPQK